MKIYLFRFGNMPENYVYVASTIAEGVRFVRLGIDGTTAACNMKSLTGL